MGDSRSVSIIAVIAGLVLTLDQVSKAMIVATLGPGQSAASIDLIRGWFSLQYGENRGVAFGLFAGAGPVLIVAAVLTLLVLGWYAVRSPQQPLSQIIAFGLVLGGAVGNVFDRVRLGFVIDFISIGWWPNFNIADSAISVGVLLMLLGWIVPSQQMLSMSRR